jgi:hypothetical protein
MAGSISNNNQVNGEAAGFFLQQLEKMTALVEKCQSDLNAISTGAQRQPNGFIHHHVEVINDSIQESELSPPEEEPSPKPRQTFPLEDSDTANVHKDDSESAVVPKDEAESPTGQKEDSETLRIHLRELEAANPQCVLSVRKINRLGFDSRALLERHFAWYGVPSQVLVAHLRVKSSGRRPARTRPAGLGFVVMATVADAERVLSLGEKQLIGDVDIQVCRFQRLGPGEQGNAEY